MKQEHDEENDHARLETPCGSARSCYRREGFASLAG